MNRGEKQSGFDPLTLPESNATSYPEQFRAGNQERWNRRLGDHAGLTNYGVNMTRIVPGGQSSHRHAHLRQDEFIVVMQGTVELETNAGIDVMKPGMCAGFPAGTGNAHRFVNRSAEDVLLLVIGDRTAAMRCRIRTSTCTARRVRMGSCDSCIKTARRTENIRTRPI